MKSPLWDGASKCKRIALASASRNKLRRHYPQNKIPKENLSVLADMWHNQQTLGHETHSERMRVRMSVKCSRIADSVPFRNNHASFARITWFPAARMNAEGRTERYSIYAPILLFSFFTLIPSPIRFARQPPSAAFAVRRTFAKGTGGGGERGAQ